MTSVSPYGVTRGDLASSFMNMVTQHFTCGLNDVMASLSQLDASQWNALCNVMLLDVF